MGQREGGEHPNETRSIIASTTGGVMTEEVGAITGDLEVATHLREAEGAEVSVRYVGTDEWYTVQGSPIKLGNAGDLSTTELRGLHERMVRYLTTPGKIVESNEQPTSLLRFSPTSGGG